MDDGKGYDGRLFVPVSVAALRLRVTVQRVYQLIEEGKLQADKCGSTWLVHTSSVESRIELQEGETDVRC